MISRRTERGFVLAQDILIFIGVLALTTSFILLYFIPAVKSAKAAKLNVEQRIAVKNILSYVWLTNLKYAERNCVGWDSNNCRGLTLTPWLYGNYDSNTGACDNNPVPYPSSPGTPQVGCFLAVNVLVNEADKVEGMFRGARCSVIQRNENYSGNPNVVQLIVSCVDGSGKRTAWLISNPHIPNEIYDYQNPTQVQIMYPISGGPSAVRRIDLSRVWEFSYQRTQRKAYTLLSALKSFHRRVKMMNMSQPCTADGGMNSWDDSVVPWVWLVLSSGGNLLCSGSEADNYPCGCSSLEGTWVVDSFASDDVDSNPNTVRYEGEWDRVLQNLGLGPEYRTDGFGNPFTLVLLSAENGGPIVFSASTLNAPPRPKPILCAVQNGPCYDQTWETFIRSDLRVWGSTLGVLVPGVGYMDFWQVVYE